MRLAVGCFGKLPIHGDFIRHRATPQVNAFDEWIQNGIVFAAEKRATFDADFPKAPIERFIFRPPGSAQFLVGVWMPAHDKPGRLYPFTVFACVDAGAFLPQPHLIPLAFTRFLDGAMSVCTRRWPGVKELTAAVDALETEQPETVIYPEQLRATGSEFWTEVLETFDNPAKYLLMSNLEQVAQASAELPKVGIKFPLARSEHGSSAYVSLWMDVAFRVVGSKGIPPVAFWNPSSGLHLFFREATPHTFMHLVWPGVDSDYVCDLAREGDVAGARDRLARPLRVILEDERAPITALLDVLHSARGT